MGDAELTLSEEEIRNRIRAGDPTGIRALKAQVDDWVDNDPLLQDFSRQLARGDGPGCLVMKGSALWAPIRGAGDWSEWGDWEAWEECTIGPCNNGTAVGPVATGGWQVWHAATGQTYGYPSSQTNTCQKAQMMAVTLNAGKKTRVVPAGAAAPYASELNFAELAVKVGAEMERLNGVTNEGAGI